MGLTTNNRMGRKLDTPQLRFLSTKITLDLMIVPTFVKLCPFIESLEDQNEEDAQPQTLRASIPVGFVVLRS
jgi:hypothetical protein